MWGVEEQGPQLQVPVETQTRVWAPQVSALDRGISVSPRASLAWEDKGGQDVPWFCPIMCFPLVVLQSDIVLKVKLEKLETF